MSIGKKTALLGALLILTAGSGGCSTQRPRPARDGAVADGAFVDSGALDGTLPPDGARDGASADGESPYVHIVYPAQGEQVPNPVTFEFEAGGGVEQVEFTCDGWALQDQPIPADAESHVYDFSGVNYQRHVVVTGLDGQGNPVATDEVDFTPFEEACRIAPQPGFNDYTVRAINDWARFPKDGTFPYCWEYQGSTCGGTWGQIHDGRYADVVMFPGGGDCFCSGHTLEIFLWAYRLWLAENGLGEDVLFSHGGNVLAAADVDVGDFYQRWQGFGVATYASSADAFEEAGIGENLYESDWGDVLPGDYVNLSRSTGTGHAVIFVEWIWDNGERAGLRYYGCNSGGDSCPDPGDPENTSGNSGPSFVTEYFSDHGGTVLKNYLFIGRVFLPAPPP
jgi:hypothetical protein